MNRRSNVVGNWSQWDIKLPMYRYHELPTHDIQGASGIAARFLKASPASAVSPIMTKFSQYTPHSTCYLVLVFICWQD